MQESESFEITTDQDIMRARMRTRQMARQAGLAILDQARISMAMSVLAQTLELGKINNGTISICILDNDSRRGLEVDCITKGEFAIDSIMAKLRFEEWRQMVDDIIVRFVSPEDLQVTLVKLNS
ncbi:MAG: hypothetical protein EHM70_01265 [Chloroflexota bacterium]|nr:MAG: hypothetical protein EHM70_01265 [Chloroflexota bacterium]